MSPHSQLIRYSSLTVCTPPIFSYLYGVAFWWCASLSLGQRALPSIHDPGDFFFGIPLLLHIILMLLSLSVAPLVLAVGYRRGQFARHAIAYTSCLILSITLFRLDAYQVTTWLAD